MASFREYKFFRSFSTKVENWSVRKAEGIWRKMRERKIAGKIETILWILLFRVSLFPFCIVHFDLFETKENLSHNIL